jgi:uncharacterized SAM-binding protein YcdF (DUF218 family)
VSTRAFRRERSVAQRSTLGSRSAYYRVPRRLVHTIALILLVATALIALGAALWLRAAAGFLIVAERLPQHADAIVVLGGGGRNGSRELQAARLYAAGLAPLVITTGGPVAGLETRATYSQWSIDRLVRRGVPPRAVMATNEGDSTFTDAEGVRRLAEARGWHDLLLVTDSWHTRRTDVLFQHAFRDSGVRLWISPAPGAPGDTFDQAAWWRDEDAIQAVLTEYIKLASFWLLGRS